MKWDIKPFSTHALTTRPQTKQNMIASQSIINSFFSECFLFHFHFYWRSNDGCSNFLLQLTPFLALFKPSSLHRLSCEMKAINWKTVMSFSKLREPIFHWSDLTFSSHKLSACGCRWTFAFISHFNNNANAQTGNVIQYNGIWKWLLCPLNLPSECSTLRLTSICTTVSDNNRSEIPFRRFPSLRWV